MESIGKLYRLVRQNPKVRHGTTFSNGKIINVFGLKSLEEVWKSNDSVTALGRIVSGELALYKQDLNRFGIEQI